jgi:serine/threonine protein kinase
VSSSIPKVGSRLLAGGRLRVLRELGRGSMGVVLEVFDERSGGKAAIKIMGAAEDPELRLRFLREAKASQKLTSPHALRVLEVGELDDHAKTPFMLTEVLEGMSLGDLLVKMKSFSPLAIVKWCREALHALTEAHALGLVHRDLKPDNLFVVAANNTVKVIDFGIVKDTAATQSLTRTGEGFGSPAYMSPEQIHGQKNLDARADIWSLGVTMFELLIGRVPFDQESVSNVFWAVLNTTAPRVRDLRPDVPAKLDAIVARCLERDADRRYANARELDAALLDVEQTTTDPVEPPPTERDKPPVSGAVTLVELLPTEPRRKQQKPPRRTGTKRRRKLTVVYVASLFAVLGVGGLALVGLLSLRSSAKQTNNNSTDPPPIVVTSPPPTSSPSEESSPVQVAPSASPSTSSRGPHLPVVRNRPDAGGTEVAQVTRARGTGEVDFIDIQHLARPEEATGDVDITGFDETIKGCTGVSTGCASAVIDIDFHNSGPPTTARLLTDPKCDAVGQCIIRKNASRRIKQCEPQNGKADSGGVWFSNHCIRSYRVTVDAKPVRTTPPPPR